MVETVELRELRVFLTLCEELHFGRTAERLGITPSRVSQTIARLEAVMGGVLFERTSRRVALSPRGEELRRAVHGPYHELLGALTRSAAAGRGIAGELRIGMLTFIAGHAMDRVITAFERRFPDCSVELVEVLVEDPLGPLRRGEIDALVARLSRDALPDIEVGPVILREPRVLAVANDHPLATHDSVSFEVVADYAVADVKGLPDGMRDAVSPPTTPSGRPIRRGVTVRSVPEVLAAVARGDIVHPTAASLRDYVNHPGVTFVAPPRRRARRHRAAAPRRRRRPADRRLRGGGRGDRRAGSAGLEEVGRGLDERVDDLPGAGVTVAGWKQRVDVTPGDALLDRAGGDAAVVADEQARDPADAVAADDQTAGGERVGRGRHDARVESGVAAGLDEEALGGGDDPVVLGELGQ